MQQNNNSNDVNINKINPEDNILNRAVKKIQKSLSSLDGSQNFKELRKFSKKVVGVYGTVGGIGVSSFIKELSVLFSKNYKVLVIDGNFLLPNQIINHLSNTNTSINSLTNLLEEDVKEEQINNIFKKSFLSTNINYCNQEPVSLLNYIKFEEDFKSYNTLTLILEKYKTLFDVIIIDLCPNLLLTGLEQALLKSCDYLIQLYNNSVASKYNKLILEESIALTSKANIKTLAIHNKVKEKPTQFLYLPYEPKFYEIYNDAKSFLISGKSNNNLYIHKFKDIYTILVKDLY